LSHADTSCISILSGAACSLPCIEGPHETVRVNPNCADWEIERWRDFRSTLKPPVGGGRYALSPDAVSRAVTGRIKDGSHCHLHFAPAAPQKSHRHPPSTQAGSLCVLASLNLACWPPGCAPASVSIHIGSTSKAVVRVLQRAAAPQSTQGRISGLPGRHPPFKGLHKSDVNGVRNLLQQHSPEQPDSLSGGVQNHKAIWTSPDVNLQFAPQVRLCRFIQQTRKLLQKLTTRK